MREPIDLTEFLKGLSNPEFAHLHHAIRKNPDMLRTAVEREYARRQQRSYAVYAKDPDDPS